MIHLGTACLALIPRGLKIDAIMAATVAKSGGAADTEKLMQTYRSKENGS